MMVFVHSENGERFPGYVRVADAPGFNYRADLVALEQLRSRNIRITTSGRTLCYLGFEFGFQGGGDSVLRYTVHTFRSHLFLFPKSVQKKKSRENRELRILSTVRRAETTDHMSPPPTLAAFINIYIKLRRKRQLRPNFVNVSNNSRRYSSARFN